jgi:hypothetical protein
MADTFTEQAPESETVTSEPEEVTPEETEEATAKVVANMSGEAMRARWQARRPSIAHLKPAVVSQPGELNPATGLMAMLTLPLFDVGDRIVVDVRTHFLTGDPWLHTLVGKVRSIDDDTGVVSLWDEESDIRCPMVRWVSFMDALCEFRLAPAKGDPFAVSAVRAAAKPAPVPGEEKRGRGRPKGSLNRSKEEIAAEREAYRKMREEKKARRGR